MGDGLKRLRRMDRSDGTAGRLTSTFGVRLAGAALCTAGLAFIGYGTAGTPLFHGSLTDTDPGCTTSQFVCLKEAHEGVTAATAPSQVGGLTCDFTSAHPEDDAWLFVLPDEGTSPTPVFVSGTFFAYFNDLQIQGDVGGGGQPSNKFAVVYAPAGSTLDEAYSKAVENGTATTVTNDSLFGKQSDSQGFNITGLCAATTTGTTTNTTATVSTTKTVTAPGTTVTTTISGPTTTTTAPGTTTTATAPGTTKTKTDTVSTATTVTVPTTVTDNTTQTNTLTTTVTKTITTTVTASGTTVTETTTVPTTNTVTTTVTSNHTATTTVTAPTTVTEQTTATNATTATATTTKTVTTGSASSPASSTSSSSSSSSTPTSGVAAATTTPSTGSGSDIAFGTGLVLLVTGGGLIAGATRITRRKKS